MAKRTFRTEEELIEYLNSLPEEEKRKYYDEAEELDPTPKAPTPSVKVPDGVIDSVVGGGSGSAAASTATGASTAAGATTTIAAGQSIPAGYTAVGTAANGGTMVAPTSIAGGTTAGSALAGTAGVVAGAYTGFQQFKGLKNVTKGKELTPVQQAALFLPTFGGSVLYNPIRKATGGITNKDQIGRNATRDALKQMGAIGEDYSLKLADGSSYNMGNDGKFKLENLGGGSRRAYDTDTSNPLTHQAVGWANALGEAVASLTDGSDKTRSDTVGQVVNAALSNAKNEDDVRKNMQSIYGNFKFDSDTMTDVLKDLYENKKQISKDEFNAALYGIGTLFNGKSAANSEKPESVKFQGKPLGTKPVGIVLKDL